MDTEQVHAGYICCPVHKEVCVPVVPTEQQPKSLSQTGNASLPYQNAIKPRTFGN